MEYLRVPDDTDVEAQIAKLKRCANQTRCRSYRQRKRARELQIHKDNLHLKRTRLELIEQIATLEEEVAQLQGQLAVDLSQENSKLRQEVQKYKSCVKNLVDAVNACPLDMFYLKQESQIRPQVEFAVNQSIGLLCEQHVWTQAEQFSFPLGVGQVPHCIVPKIHFSPSGCNLEAAHRVNILLTLDSFDASVDELHEMQWQYLKEFHSLKKTQFSNMTHIQTLELEPVLERTRVTPLEEIMVMSIEDKCVKYQKDHNIEGEYIFSSKEVHIKSKAISGRPSTSAHTSKGRTAKLFTVVPSRPRSTKVDTNASFDNLATSTLVLEQLEDGRTRVRVLLSTTKSGWVEKILGTGPSIVVQRNQLHENCIQFLEFHTKYLHDLVQQKAKNAT